MIKKSLVIKIACFLSAFAVMVAGFLFREFLINAAMRDRADAIDNLTLSEFAKNIEKMPDTLSSLLESTNDKKGAICAEIMLEASLARSALGFTKSDCPVLFSFLKSVSELSALGIEGNIDKEIFSLFYIYSKRICDDALQYFLNDKKQFETVVSEIFSDTSLETILYEKGYGDYAVSSGFESLGNGNGRIDEKEAIKTAKKYLGKNAYLSAGLSEGEHPFFHITGKNVSALISAVNGAIIQLLFDLPEGNINITEGEAEIRAKNFLSETGSANDTLTKLSAVIDGGLYLFEYAPIRNGVLCISERILLGVSTESGRICIFDAVDFYRYKTKRITLPDKMLKAEDIMNIYSLSELPELCKIERKKGIESICYRLKNEDGYRYISAISGDIIS